MSKAVVNRIVMDIRDMNYLLISLRYQFVLNVKKRAANTSFKVCAITSLNCRAIT